MQCPQVKGNASAQVLTRAVADAEMHARTRTHLRTRPYLISGAIGQREIEGFQSRNGRHGSKNGRGRRVVVIDVVIHVIVVASARQVEGVHVRTSVDVPTLQDIAE